MNMLKRLVPLLLALCLCAVLLGGCGGGTAKETPAPAAAASTAPAAQTAAATPAPETPAEVVTLILADGNAVNSQRYNQLNVVISKLQEISGGQLQVEFYAGGVLFNDREALEGLMNDTASFAFINPGNASATVPDVAIMSMPGTYQYASTDDETTLIDFEAAIHDAMVEIYEPFGIRYLTLHPPTECAIICTEETITSPDQAKGHIFRTSGTYLGKLMENWGFATTTVVVSDVATALQKNTVEGTVTGCDVATMWNWYELAPYITVLPYCDTLGSICMSGDSWGSLNDQQKAWVQEAADAYIKEALKMKIEFSDKCYETWEKNGVTTTRLSADEAKVFLGDYYAPVEEEIKAGCTENGLKLIEILDQWNGRT